MHSSLYSLSLFAGACSDRLLDLFLASLTCVEVLVAVDLRPESAGPGQVATRVHSELMLSPLPSQPSAGYSGPSSHG